MPPPRLLIRLGSLGDVVLATAAANALAERHGDHGVDVLVKSEWAALWEGHPAVREVLPWPPGERGPSGIAAWARRLRGRGYAECIDLQASPRTRALALLAGLGGIRRPVRHPLRRRALVRWKRWGPPEGWSVVRSFVEAAAPGSRALPSLHPGAAARERAAGILPGTGAVGLAPGARHATKRWPLDRFVALGRRLAATGPDPIPVFWGPEEGGLRAQWASLWPQDGSWIDVQEPLAVVPAVMERIRALVSNDTGLMHVAAGVGVPVVALFGPTVREFGFFPAGAGHRVLERAGLDCRPCSVHGGPHCPRGHFRCMLDLDPAHVLEAVHSVPDRSPLITRAPAG